MGVDSIPTTLESLSPLAKVDVVFVNVPVTAAASAAVPNGETAEDVAARVRRVIDRAAAVPGDVVLFSHGHALRVLAAVWLRLAPEDGERFYLETGTISILGFERDMRVIRMWNGRV